MESTFYFRPERLEFGNRIDLIPLSSLMDRMADLLDHSLLTEKINNLTGSTGVYLWKDKYSKVIYVGKAIDLKKRVQSYLKERVPDIKTKRLQSEIRDLDWIVTRSEKEALIVEANLIKKFNPKYNVRLKDDKKYPYICVSLSEMFPRVFVTRKLKDNGDRYFGPYTDVRSARAALDVIHRIFPIRKKNLKLPLAKPQRPCLNFQMKRCLAPCTGEVSRDEYFQVVDQILQFLDGRRELLEGELRKRMTSHSEKLEFEMAARFRDMLERIQNFREKQTVVSMDGGDEDVISFARKDDEGQVVLMEVRSGRLEGKKSFPIQGLSYSSDSEILLSFIRDYYLNASFIPRFLILPVGLEGDSRAILDYLTDKTGFTPKLRFPKAGEKKSLIRVAEKNAEMSLTERLLATKYRDQTAGLRDLQKMLHLAKSPSVIECYDISHFQGSQPVASGVQFVDGKPNRSGYRKYNMRGYEGINDPGMMHEVIARRLQRLVNEEQKLPDLIVIDGGPTQLGKACEAANALDLTHIPMIGLAKKREEVYFPGEKEPYIFEKNSAGMKIIRHLRDEAHRFGIEHHRSRRNKASMKELVTEVPDIGWKRSRILLSHFAGRKKIEEASKEELREIPGIGESLAGRIWNFFHQETPNYVLDSESDRSMKE